MIINDSIEYTGYFLKSIINESLNKIIMPELWKISTVIPIPVKAEEYRPINTLPPDEKMIEKYVKKQLVEHINKNNILVKQQSGFGENHSCETTLNYVINKIKCDIGEGNIVIVIFLDLKRAFETVDRDILLRKMKEYGIRGKEWKWFKSYLTNRKQKTKFNEITSKEKNIDIGLPQGSGLGPICFTLYINDIVKAPKIWGNCSICKRHCDNN